MHIITPGNTDYLKFFSSAKLEHDKYVQSKFVLRYNTERGMLLCNTLTGELILLSPKEAENYESESFLAIDNYKELISRRYLVSTNCREEYSLEQVRAVFLKRKEATGFIYHYNILPTTFCNARCFYCYEHGIPRLNMSAETADRLVQFISDHYGGQHVTLNWFGGEPMVGRDMIDRICKKTNELKIPYESKMVSNGYLFDEKIIMHAIELWHLKRVQITLDGTESIYNRTKAYINARDNPYQRVLHNIHIFIEAGIRVDIRLNLDSHNADDLYGLIDELTNQFHGNRNMTIYVKQLDQNVGFAPIQHDQFELEGLIRQETKIYEMLEKKGWPLSRTEKLPSLQICSCMADDPASIQCTPDGIISKCEDQIYNHVIGTLNDGITNKKEVLWWRERTIREGCESCPLLPSCQYQLVNCPGNSGKCPSYYKEGRISRYHEIMKMQFEDWLSHQ